MFFYGIDMYRNGRVIRPNGRNTVDFLYKFLYAITHVLLATNLGGIELLDFSVSKRNVTHLNFWLSKCSNQIRNQKLYVLEDSFNFGFPPDPSKIQIKNNIEITTYYYPMVFITFQLS